MDANKIFEDIVPNVETDTLPDDANQPNVAENDPKDASEETNEGSSRTELPEEVSEITSAVFEELEDINETMDVGGEEESEEQESGASDDTRNTGFEIYKSTVSSDAGNTSFETNQSTYSGSLDTGTTSSETYKPTVSSDAGNTSFETDISTYSAPSEAGKTSSETYKSTVSSDAGNTSSETYKLTVSSDAGNTSFETDISTYSVPSEAGRTSFDTVKSTLSSDGATLIEPDIATVSVDSSSSGNNSFDTVIEGEPSDADAALDALQVTVSHEKRAIDPKDLETACEVSLQGSSGAGPSRDDITEFDACFSQSLEGSLYPAYTLITPVTPPEERSPEVRRTDESIISTNESVTGSVDLNRSDDSSTSIINFGSESRVTSIRPGDTSEVSQIDKQDTCTIDSGSEEKAVEVSQDDKCVISATDSSLEEKPVKVNQSDDSAIFISDSGSEDHGFSSGTPEVSQSDKNATYTIDDSRSGEKPGEVGENDKSVNSAVDSILGEKSVESHQSDKHATYTVDSRSGEKPGEVGENDKSVNSAVDSISGEESVEINPSDKNATYTIDSDSGEKPASELESDLSAESFIPLFESTRRSDEIRKSNDDSKNSPDTSLERTADTEEHISIEYVELEEQEKFGPEGEERDNDPKTSNAEVNNADEEIQGENPLFIGDKEDTEKDSNNLDVDPIASDGFISENQQGADEELCIIPDTERVISQEEKEAAFSIPPLRDISEASTSNDVTDDGVAALAPIGFSSADKIQISKCNIEELQTCVQCRLKRKVNYTATRGDTVQFICHDNCLDNYKIENVNEYVLTWDCEIRVVKNLTVDDKEAPKLPYERKCVVCQKKTDDEENNLTWEIMDFCNEYCLSKYQKDIGSVCANCNTDVRPTSLGKYCVRFGNDIRQFCSSHCLEEFKKGLKVCSYCQHDMSTESDGFLAPVGDKGQFKDFCSQICMEKYDIMTKTRPPKVDEGTICSVCKKSNQITIEYDHDGVKNYFCSDRCFVAFSFVNNITARRCSMCRRYFANEILEKNIMFYDNVQYSFCSNSCQNIYIIAHRKIVPCVWCKVKKYNFDMIRRYFKTGPVLNMCSINCLSLFQVSLNAVNSKNSRTVCNFCNKRHQPMYHLTMSDATIRNFCSYACVMSFQNKFKKSPITISSNSDEPQYPVPAGEPKKNRKYGMGGAEPSKPNSPPLPVISSVQSLANKNGNYTSPQSSKRTKTISNPPQQQHILNTNVEPQIQIKHHIFITPPLVPDQRNVATMCKLRQNHKATSARVTTCEIGIQTDQREAEKILIPVPIPVYVPAPLPMYSVAAPYPLPFALPIPVPVFIPTTRNSAKGIMKEIKKIQVKIPTDPYEAELLMMAEMVAGDKKEDNTDSESDVDDPGPGDEASFSPEPVDASNTFGDDMLQMALKMATELEEPAVDLEGALTANTITAPQGSETTGTEEAEDDPPMIAERQQSFRGRKRGARGAKQGGTKRRRTSQPVEPVTSSQPVAPPEPAEKPDAHLCLKYTFGVNAWKQWVTTKNAELEKANKYAKPFKTEILQLTADELNYSLCLFVNEVRKPNGAEYAPDTIYYLCLGIQQYLFENNRIDNIFCDPYYEQFTDCLDEVAKKFSVLYNDSHYIVTRVEEEHLWESKQLGAHSPHVLLSTLMFFNTKHFNLTSVQEHMQLSFSHIMKHWKRNPNQPGAPRVPGSRNVLLRFYPPQSAMQNNARKKKVYEQQENDENPLRCPVKLYEFYLSKCPESVKTRNDVFYLQPERSCVPDSPVWYSTTALPQEALEKMLHRVKMVKEINVALLTS